MNEGVITTIGEMLEHCSELVSNAFIFAQIGQLRQNNLALVYREGLYGSGHVPELASANGLRYLMTDTYKDIAINLRLQIAKPSLIQRFEALVFYVENDAFKVW